MYVPNYHHHATDCELIHNQYLYYWVKLALLSFTHSGPSSFYPISTPFVFIPCVTQTESQMEHNPT